MAVCVLGMALITGCNCIVYCTLLTVRVCPSTLLAVTLTRVVQSGQSVRTVPGTTRYVRSQENNDASLFETRRREKFGKLTTMWIEFKDDINRSEVIVHAHCVL